MFRYIFFNKKFLNHLKEVIINVLNSSPPAESTIFPVKNKQIRFVDVWPSVLHLWTDANLKSTCFRRFVMSNMSKRKMFIPFFEENYPLITIKHTPARTQKGKKNNSFLAESCRLPIGCYSHSKTPFQSQFIHLQPTVRQDDFLGLQQCYWVISRLWTTFSYSDCNKHISNEWQ